MSEPTRTWLFGDTVAVEVDGCTCGGPFGDHHEPSCGLEFIGYVETDERVGRRRSEGWEACKASAMAHASARGDISAQMNLSRMRNPYLTENGHD